jgi:hypothetical protein
MLLRLFVILAIATPQSSNAINRNVQIVFVQQPGETFTIKEQQIVVASVKDAIVFWHDLSPVTTTLAIASTELLTTTFDVYDNPQWFNANHYPVATLQVQIRTMMLSLQRLKAMACRTNKRH